MLKRPLSFDWYPHHFVYGGVGWWVSSQGERSERRGCRGDWGRLGDAHGAERRRLRESSPGPRIRRGAGGLNWGPLEAELPEKE